MNEDDRLLKALADVARAEPQEDPRWEAVVRGEAAAPDDAPAHVAALFAPLDDAARSRIADAMLAKLGGDGAKVVPISKKRSAFMAWMGGAVTAAAVAAGVLLMRAPHGGDLPAYAIAMEGGDKVDRGAAATSGVPKIAPGSRVAVTLRPATRAEGEVKAKAFLAKNGAVRAWNPPMQIAEGGAVRVEGTREALFEDAAEGALEMIFAVGRPEALPTEAEVTEKLARGEEDVPKSSAYKLLRYRVELTPRE